MKAKARADGSVVLLAGTQAGRIGQQNKKLTAVLANVEIEHETG